MLVNSSSLFWDISREISLALLSGLRTRFSVARYASPKTSLFCLRYEGVSISRKCSSNLYPNSSSKIAGRRLNFFKVAVRIIRRRSNFAFASEGVPSSLERRSLAFEIGASSFRALNGTGRCRAPQNPREEEQGGRLAEMERRGKDAAFQYWRQPATLPERRDVSYLVSGTLMPSAGGRKCTRMPPNRRCVNICARYW